MPSSYDTLFELIDKKLLGSKREVAKVAVYLIAYLLDRTRSRSYMLADELFVTSYDKLKALAWEPEKEVTDAPESMGT